MSKKPSPPVLSRRGFFITVCRMRSKRSLVACSIMLALAMLPVPAKSVERISWLVITAPGCESAVADLVKHRQNQGETVKSVKLTDIFASSPAGTPVYWQLWNYLNDNYKSMNLSQVLFVGDTNDIPMAKLYEEDYTDKQTNPRTTYTDVFYQMLGINWDKDKDGRLGEPTHDAIVFSPTIAFGRIPFSDPTIVAQVCKSIIGYDNSPYRKSILQAGSIYLYDKEDGDPSNTFTDGADMTEVIWKDTLQPHGFNRATMYEAEGLRPKNKPMPKSDKDLNQVNLMNYLTGMDFGMVNILAHGTPDRLNRRVWYPDENNDGVPQSSEIKHPELISADRLYGKTIRSSIVIATACSTANIAGGAETLATAMLKQGAGAYIGATTVNYFTPSWSKPSDGGNQTITYNLTKYYCEGESLGWAMARTMKQFYNEFSNKPYWSQIWASNVYSFILLGDPAMRLEPLQPKAAMPMTFNPPSLTIPAGDKDQTTLTFGIQSSKYELSLDYQSSQDGISVTFVKPNPLPNEQVTVIVSVTRNTQPKNYTIEINCASKTFEGHATLGIQVTAPRAGYTEVELLPDYIYAQQDQEFWVDLVIKPGQPVMSLSGSLQYDPTVLQLVDKRLGDFSTFDYMCVDWQVVPAPDKNRILFSFFRNNDRIGATSTDIAFSFCFRGKKESISDLIASPLDIKTPQQKSHIIAGNPSSRVKIHPQGMFLKVSSKTVNGDERVIQLTGTASPNQQLTINDELINMSTDGKFSKTYTLTRFKNEFVIKVDNIQVDVSGKILLDRALLFRKVVLWSSRKELAFRIGSKNAWNNGDCSKLDVEPQIISGSTMVPWRYISEQLGFKVSFNASTKQITAKRNGTTIVMTIGKTSATVNGASVTLSVAPVSKSGSTLVPLRFVGEAVGAEVGWKPQYQLATVFSPK